MDMSPRSKTLVWAGRIVSILPMFLFGMSATMKLMGHQSVIDGMNHLGLPGSLIQPS